MSAVYEGTVTLTGGSNQMVGQGTAFTAAEPGDSVVVIGIAQAFQVAHVVDATHILLSRPCPLPSNQTKSGLSYVISRDFSPIMQSPYPHPGEPDTLSLWQRTLASLDALLKTVAG